MSRNHNVFILVRLNKGGTYYVGSSAISALFKVAA